MSITEKTIEAQYAFWQRAPLGLRAEREATLAVVGCGTSYNLALSVAAAANANGIRAVAVPGNEWVRRPEAYLADWRDATVVALSRSGESTETVAAARRSLDAGLTVVGITCADGSSLVHASTTTLYAETDPDEGIVMTTSASLMLLLGLHYVHAEIDVPAAAAAAQRMCHILDRQIAALLRDTRHVVYLAAGTAYGIAVEGGLKLQEMSQVFTQAYHPLEYRHGPISLVDRHTLVVMLYSPESVAEETQVAQDVRGLGARVLGIGGPGDVEISLSETGGTRLLSLLPPLQLLGERMAGSRSLDTTAPRHLAKIVRLATVA